MGDLSVGYAYLEDLHLYGPPNPALAEILLGPRLYAIVAAYTAKVIGNVQVQYAAAPHGRGRSMASMEASVDINNSNKRDRWAGQITVAVPYAAATQYGRTAYAPYSGREYLTKGLYGVLPNKP